MKRENSDTTQLTINAMLAALCAVLGYVSLEMGNFKLTFESVPVLMAALMYGPVSGALVGGVGTFIYQILRYGITVTTPLWIMPYVMAGFTVGLYAKKHNFSSTNKQLMLIIICAQLLIFVVNTASLTIDSLVYGYYSTAFIFGTLGLRFIVAIGKGIAFAAVLPVILKKFSRLTRIHC